MIFQVRHVTKVKYSSIVRLARFNLRLMPAHWPGQEIAGYRLIVDPQPSAIVTDSGAYVVNISRLTLAEPIAQLRIESQFTVTKQTPAAAGVLPGPTVAQLRRDALGRRDLSEYGPAAYLFASRMVRIEPEIGGWAGAFIDYDDSILSAGAALMNAIYSQFQFDADATETNTPPLEAFRKRRGVCQDFAQIMIAALRAHGIPAAYVSGYLRTRPPPGRAPLIGADATHAWVNIWCGAELGWIGFDPTNNVSAQGDHIFTAMGRDYADVAPIYGVFYGAPGQQLDVAVDVSPASEPIVCC